MTPTKNNNPDSLLIAFMFTSCGFHFVVDDAAHPVRRHLNMGLTAHKKPHDRGGQGCLATAFVGGG
jgi:hypothetical protein